MSVTQGNDQISHHQYMASWCQEQSLQREDAHVQRGFTANDSWEPLASNSTRSSQIGYRPILIPLDPQTLEPKPSLFLGREDGDMLRMGCLYMDGIPQTNPKKPTPSGDIPNYIPGAKLRIGDNSPNPEDWITWIKVGNALVCDRNLMKNISIDDLELMDLVRGQEHLQNDRKVSLNHLLESAQKRTTVAKPPSESRCIPVGK